MIVVVFYLLTNLNNLWLLGVGRTFDFHDSHITGARVDRTHSIQCTAELS